MPDFQIPCPNCKNQIPVPKFSPSIGCPVCGAVVEEIPMSFYQEASPGESGQAPKQTLPFSGAPPATFQGPSRPPAVEQSWGTPPAAPPPQQPLPQAALAYSQEQGLRRKNPYSRAKVGETILVSFYQFVDNPATFLLYWLVPILVSALLGFFQVQFFGSDMEAFINGELDIGEAAYNRLMVGLFTVSFVFWFIHFLFFSGLVLIVEEQIRTGTSSASQGFGVLRERFWEILYLALALGSFMTLGALLVVGGFFVCYFFSFSMILLVLEGKKGLPLEHSKFIAKQRRLFWFFFVLGLVFVVLYFLTGIVAELVLPGGELALAGAYALQSLVMLLILMCIINLYLVDRELATLESQFHQQQGSAPPPGFAQTGGPPEMSQ